MKEKIFIEDLGEKCEVWFEADPEFIPEQKEGLEQEPIPAYYEFEEITWDKSLYTTEENKIIEDAIVKVEAELNDLAVLRDEESLEYCPW